MAEASSRTATVAALLAEHETRHAPFRFLCHVAAVVFVALAWASTASAMSSCEGSYAATPLHPLPQHIVVGLDIHDASPRNQRLADRFLAGVREAGVVVGAEPNVLLHVNSSRLNEALAGPSRGQEQSYPELTGMQGGAAPTLPAIPSDRLTAPRTPRAPSMLILRIDATEGHDPRISWVASVQCRFVGADEGQRAQDLGRLIGAALGKRIERSPI